MHWYHAEKNQYDKWCYEKLLNELAQQISDELLEMYLRQEPTDKTFDELLTERLPPHYSKHHFEISFLAGHILFKKGYNITLEPGKFLETLEEEEQKKRQYRQACLDSYRHLIPQAQAITAEIIAHCRQNGADNTATFAELVYPHAQEATSDEYTFLLEYIIDGINAAGYTIDSFAPLTISLTFHNTLKPTPFPPEPEPPTNPLRRLYQKLFD